MLEKPARCAQRGANRNGHQSLSKESYSIKLVLLRETRPRRVRTRLLPTLDLEEDGPRHGMSITFDSGFYSPLLTSYTVRIDLRRYVASHSKKAATQPVTARSTLHHFYSKKNSSSRTDGCNGSCEAPPSMSGHPFRHGRTLQR